ncbi:MAG: GNAT family N-acetyltransferase [Ectothiorhodospiraceae bacterium]|nr:GNAT family N-acetyltransferase [Ectothiorhodospiraceae bacterium]
MSMHDYLSSTAPVRFQPLTRADRDAIVAFYDALSPVARYQRFHHPVTRLTPGLITLLCNIDGRDHAAIGAVVGTALVGVGHCVRLPEMPDSAEIAFAVSDRWQGCGLGRLLLQELAEHALQNGIARFHFSVLEENDAAVRLLAAADASLHTAGGQTHGEAAVAAYLPSDNSTVFHPRTPGISRRRSSNPVAEVTP